MNNSLRRSGIKYKLVSKFKPSGDQPKAIKEIMSSLKSGNKYTVLLGATGTGKTFTIANIIEKYQKQTLVLAPNKTLANQLYLELKSLFPNNRVEYYISNFDFYQPEAYKPNSDTYIEKSSQQNWQLEMMRVAATTSVLTRNDTIVVASVAAIFGHRHPEEYKGTFFELAKDTHAKRKDIFYNLIKLNYQRKDELSPGSFTVKGDVIEIAPSWTDQFHVRVELYGDVIEYIAEINNITKDVIKQHDRYTIYPATFHATADDGILPVVEEIEKDLNIQLDHFKKDNKLLEAQRLEQKVRLDIEQLKEFGMVSGIENYSVYFDKHRKRGETPSTLMSYFEENYLLIIDESHLSIPQVKGMFNGDIARKDTLVKYGFRLPTALDNRPLKLSEFEERTGKVVFLSATPASYELEKTDGKFVEQIIRPTGLLDPMIEVRKETHQLDDLMAEIFKRKELDERVFVNTTTKKLSEDIASFMNEKGISIAYIHSDLKTLEREEVLRKLRIGVYDAVVGINLLREGIDIPEVSLVAILDANKAGFMRGTSSLIQLIGRSARNVNGKVIMYADHYSPAMEEAINITRRRRKLQSDFNKEHNITPTTIVKPIPKPVLEEFEQKHKIKFSSLKTQDKIKNLKKKCKLLRQNMIMKQRLKLEIY